MIFDVLCKIVELSRNDKIRTRDVNQQPVSNDLISNDAVHTLVKHAKIFEFSADDLDDSISTEIDKSEEEFYNSMNEMVHKHLPFQSNFFYFKTDESSDETGILVSDELLEDGTRFTIGIWEVVKGGNQYWGWIGSMVPSSANKMGFEFRLTKVFIFYNNKNDYSMIIDKVDAIEEMINKYAPPSDGLTTLQLFANKSAFINIGLAQIYHPKKFVFERTNTKVKSNGKKIPRYHQRPVFTVLKPHDIRKVMNVHSKSGRKVSGHDRRGYYRTYHNERYVNMIGKEQWIDPIWIGPSEKLIGNKKYVVRLDV